MLTASDFISSRAEVIVSPAARATSVIDWLRCSELRVASCEAALARCWVAMAKIAPLSLAEDTFMPVLIRFWVVSSWALVLFRLCRATAAP